MNRFLIFIFLVVCLVSQSFLNPVGGSVLYPIYDPLEGGMPRNLRTMLKSNKIHSNLNLKGLKQLRASGSGQFSEENFILMTQLLPVSLNKLIVIDLRQESHGFINGKPVSWTDGIHNYANLHKKRLEIESDEYLRLRLTVQLKHIVLNPLKECTTLIASHVKTERAVIESYGSIYIRLPVTDHNRPTDEILDQFIQIVRQLNSEQWVHMHCRAGKGRTTTFLTLFDMMHNAQDVSFLDILARQHLIGGVDLTQFQKKNEERERSAKERLDFLKIFYQYCQEVPDFRITWSQWLKKNV